MSVNILYAYFIPMVYRRILEFSGHGFLFSLYFYLNFPYGGWGRGGLFHQRHNLFIYFIGLFARYLGLFLAIN